MSQTQMDGRYSAALRAALVDHVAATAPNPAPRRRRRVGAGLLAGAGVLGGIGVAAAGILLLPGEDVVEDLTTPVTATFTGPQTVDLGAPPEGATHVSVALKCLSAGTFTLEDGASLTCSEADALLRNTTEYDLPLALEQQTVTVETGQGNRWEITSTYVERNPTEWAVNANGDTYGVASEAGSPDLVAVIATNGARGYVYTTDLDSHPSFEDTDEALAWQESMAGRTVMIPVHEADGETIIGEFEAGTW